MNPVCFYRLVIPNYEIVASITGECLLPVPPAPDPSQSSSSSQLLIPIINEHNIITITVNKNDVIGDDNGNVDHFSNNNDNNFDNN